MTYSELLASLQPGNSPHYICALVRGHVRYAAERKDCWQSAEETCARRAGDCEDFAILVQALCRHIGETCRLVALFNARLGKEGHVVATGSCWISSNGEFVLADPQTELRKWFSDAFNVALHETIVMPLSDKAVEALIQKGKGS